MAKSTHSQEILTGTSDSYTEHELTETDPVVRREMLGGDPKSQEIGTPSLESSESEQRSSEQETHNPPSPVQTTESPSKDTATQEDSTVIMTATSGQKGTPPRSGSRKARARTVDSKDEFD